jgi:hypothetical protein
MGSKVYNYYKGNKIYEKIRKIKDKADMDNNSNDEKY